MATLSAGNFVEVQLAANQTLSVSGGDGVGLIASAGTPPIPRSLAGGATFGPFAALTKVQLQASRDLTYTVSNPAPTSDAVNSIIPLGWRSQLSAGYRASLLSGNARTRAQLTLGAAAFGSTPSAGTVGYANTDNATPPNISGKRFFDLTAAPYLNTQNWGPFRAEGAAAYDVSAVRRQGLAYYSGGSTRVAGTWRVRFITNDPEPVIYTTGYSQAIPVIVDGQRCASNLVSKSTGGFTQVSINLRGLGAGYHTVELLFAGDSNVGGLYVGQQYQLLAPPARPVIAMITDSLGNTVNNYGSNPVSGLDAFPQHIAEWLGADVRAFVYGGSGWVVPGTGETFTARVPLAAAMLSLAGVTPSVVVFAGGVNDNAQPSAAISAAAAAAFAAAAATWPAAKLAVLGCWAQNNSANQTASTTAEQAIFSAAAAAGVATVPVMTDPSGAWITGTGTISSPTGNGTSDTLFESSDTTHWVLAGHNIIGPKVVHGLAAALGL